MSEWTPALVADAAQRLIARIEFDHHTLNSAWHLAHEGPALATFTAAQYLAARTAVQALVDAAHRDLRDETGVPTLDAALGALADFVALRYALGSTLLEPGARPLSDPYTEDAGERLVRLYEVERVLGRGTGDDAGTVYACMNRVTRQPVAVKLGRAGRYEIAINKLLTDARSAGRARLLCGVMHAVDYAFVRLQTNQWRGAEGPAGDYGVLVMEPAVCTLAVAIKTLLKSSAAPRPIEFESAQEMLDMLHAVLCQVLCQLHALAVLFPNGFAHRDLRAENVLLVREERLAHIEYRVGELVLQVPTRQFAARIADFGKAGAIYMGVHPDNRVSAVRMDMPGADLASSEHIREDIRKLVANTRIELRALCGNDQRLRGGSLGIANLDRMERALRALSSRLRPAQVVPAFFAAYPSACASYVLADAPPLASVRPLEPYATELIGAQHEYMQ